MEETEQSGRSKDYIPYDETEEYAVFYNKVRDNISTALKKAKITRKFCAEKIGINYSTMRELSGKSKIPAMSFKQKRKLPKHSAYVILQVAEITNSNPNQLLGYDENKGLGSLTAKEAALIQELRTISNITIRERYIDQFIANVKRQFFYTT